MVQSTSVTLARPRRSFQGGSIREGTHLVKGTNRSGRTRPGASPTQPYDRPVVEHTAEVRYDQGWPMTGKRSPHGPMIGSGLPILPVPAPASIAQPDKPEEHQNEVIAEQPAMIEDDTLRR